MSHYEIFKYLKSSFKFIEVLENHIGNSNRELKGCPESRKNGLSSMRNSNRELKVKARGFLEVTRVVKLK